MLMDITTGLANNIVSLQHGITSSVMPISRVQSTQIFHKNRPAHAQARLFCPARAKGKVSSFVKPVSPFGNA